MIREIELNGSKIKYSLQYKKVKNINLRIKSDGSIAVSAHKDVKIETIEGFMFSKKDIILSTLEKCMNKSVNLDFNDLTPDELKQIKAQVEFYKAHRRTFQYGRFEFVPVDNPNQLSWQVKRDGEIIAGLFQKRTCAAPYRDRLTVPSAEVSKAYSVECVKQNLRIKTFGPLINHISPIRLKADGLLVSTVDKHFSMVDGHEAYTCYGDILKSGINLEMQFEGTG